MKYLSTLAALLLAATLAPASAAHAASPLPFATYGVAQQTNNAPVLRITPRLPAASPHSRSLAAPTAAALTLPDAAFAPAKLLPPGPGDNITAQTFRGATFHTKKYADLGRTDGVLQTATFDTGGTSSISVQYLGSIYSSEALAKAAFADVHSDLTVNGSLQPTDCSQNGIQCESAEFQFTDQGNVLGIILVYQTSGPCTAELAAVGPLAAANSALTNLQSLMNNLAAAANAAVGAACPSSTPFVPPTVSLTKLVLVHKVKGKVKATKTIKLKEQVNFVVTFTSTNPGTGVPAAHITVTKKGAPIADGDMTAATASDGTPVFLAAIAFTHKTSVGSLVAHVTITLGVATDQKTLKFKLTKT